MSPALVNNLKNSSKKMFFKVIVPLSHDGVNGWTFELGKP